MTKELTDNELNNVVGGISSINDAETIVEHKMKNIDSIMKVNIKQDDLNKTIKTLSNEKNQMI